MKANDLTLNSSSIAFNGSLILNSLSINSLNNDIPVLITAMGYLEVKSNLTASCSKLVNRGHLKVSGKFKSLNSKLVNEKNLNFDQCRVECNELINKSILQIKNSSGAINHLNNKGPFQMNKSNIKTMTAINSDSDFALTSNSTLTAEKSFLNEEVGIIKIDGSVLKGASFINQGKLTLKNSQPTSTGMGQLKLTNSSRLQLKDVINKGYIHIIGSFVDTKSLNNKNQLIMEESKCSSDKIQNEQSGFFSLQNCSLLCLSLINENHWVDEKGEYSIE
ncbi:hypothetical protein FGO68_gene9284 [Halteria grandinella]|uniref:Uncharacterized protein n=1 Tax=Halteria grandinella TaxID=5974 RepID=A0A8J8P7M0_HALGN|nr:hypothetical protein FGO68_gene9284 [Halteria grandinella]